MANRFIQAQNDGETMHGVSSDKMLTPWSLLMQYITIAMAYKMGISGKFEAKYLDFHLENAFENVNYKLHAILFRPQ